MSYRDVLARRERQRPDGTPVWPLRANEIGLLTPARRLSSIDHRSERHV